MFFRITQTREVFFEEGVFDQIYKFASLPLSLFFSKGEEGGWEKGIKTHFFHITFLFDSLHSTLFSLPFMLPLLYDTFFFTFIFNKLLPYSTNFHPRPPYFPPFLNGGGFFFQKQKTEKIRITADFSFLQRFFSKRNS